MVIDDAFHHCIYEQMNELYFKMVFMEEPGTGWHMRNLISKKKKIILKRSQTHVIEIM